MKELKLTSLLMLREVSYGISYILYIRMKYVHTDIFIFFDRKTLDKVITMESNDYFIQIHIL